MTALKQALLEAGVERPVLTLRKPRTKKMLARPEPKKAPPRPGPKTNAKPKPLWEKAAPGLAWLRKEFPQVFDPRDPRPLKVGIKYDLYRLKGDELSNKGVALALCWWTRQKAYRAAVARGGHRYGLDGEVAGEVTRREREYAKERLRGNGSRAQAKR